MYTLSPKKVGYPLFSRLQKWICRASQVLMEDGKSVEEKFTDVAEDIAEVAGDVAELGQNSGGVSLLNLTLHGDGEDDTYFIIPDELQDTIDPAPSTAKGESDTKISPPIPPPPPSYVLKSEVDALAEASAGQLVLVTISHRDNSDGIVGLGICKPSFDTFPISVGVAAFGANNILDVPADIFFYMYTDNDTPSYEGAVGEVSYYSGGIKKQTSK